MKLQLIHRDDFHRPMLMLSAYEPSHVDNLCQACRDFAERRITSWSLHQQPWVHAAEGCRFIWQYTDKDIGVRHPPPGDPFVLQYSEEAWLEVEGKLAVMREPTPNTFNYLTMEGDVSVIISPDGTP